MKELKTLSSN